MRNFFQSEEYFSLFKNCTVCIPHKITFTYNGESNYVVAIQYIQNQANLPKNPVIIDGLYLPQYPFNKQIEILSNIISKLKSYHFLPFSILQIRNSDSLNNFSLEMKNWGFVFQNHINFKLETLNPETCWDLLAPNRKKQILKSINNGAEIFEAKHKSEIIELYSILSKLYHHKIGKQIPPLNIFIQFFNLSKSSNRAKVFLVKYENKIVGGNICPVDPSMKIYEWYICGLDKQYKNIYPSVLATWAPIKYASKKNIPMFDFMGAGNPYIPYGVREFKKKFGGTQINTGKFVYCI